MSTDEGPVGLDCGSAKLPDIIMLLPCPFVTVMQQCHQMRCGSNVVLGTSAALDSHTLSQIPPEQMRPQESKAFISTFAGAMLRRMAEGSVAIG